MGRIGEKIKEKVFWRNIPQGSGAEGGRSDRTGGQPAVRTCRMTSPRSRKR